MKIILGSYAIQYDTAGCFTVWQPKKEKINPRGIVRVGAKYPGTFLQAIELVAKLEKHNKKGVLELKEFLKLYKKVDEDFLIELKKLKVEGTDNIYFK